MPWNARMSTYAAHARRHQAEQLQREYEASPNRVLWILRKARVRYRRRSYGAETPERAIENPAPNKVRVELHPEDVAEAKRLYAEARKVPVPVPAPVGFASMTHFPPETNGAYWGAFDIAIEMASKSNLRGE